MNAPVRLLYVDLAAQFLNPTRSLLPVALSMSGSLDVFGPGYVASETLAAGLEAFIESRGPFDLVVTNSHVVFADMASPPPGPEAFRRSYVFDFPGADLRHLPDLALTLERLRIPRVGIFLESDYYNWTEREIEKVNRRLDVVVGFGAQFFGLKSAMPHLAQETFSSRATDAWAHFAAHNKQRIAAQTHFVADYEFSFRPLSQRQNDWAIVGIGYAARAETKRVLARHGVEVRGETPVRRGIGALKRVGLLRRESGLAIDFLNRDFRRRLATSRYAYTCGSGLDIPIRKFFEIPAAGAVLVCRPFTGFADAGFVDGVNAVVCEPQDIMDVHRTLAADPDQAQRIADAGRRLMAQYHSTAARAEQLQRLFQMVAAGRFAGASWSAGKFVVAEREVSVA
jgi:hypothetical protein